MNLFSQSKLTLKLKKQNNASSTESTNECQKSETSDSIKTEFLSNNCVLAENDSFVEILQSIQSNEEKIPMSQSIFKTSLSNQNTSNVIDESKQCPVCLQPVEAKHFITHVKSCGTSHNLSSKVLIKAVDLQQRQAAEREALGLPKVTKIRDVKKKKMCKQKQLKMGSDSNLDLAIAMSVSLQESKNIEIIKESEKLLEVGLEQEAIEKRKTLENFGFISNQPVKSKPKSFSKTNSLLFKQTKEDREKRITEKVAMILIDDTADSCSELLVNDYPNTKLVSKYLNTIRNDDNKLWKKSLLEEENICEFYVKQLIDFIRPSNSIGLKNDLNYSAHQNTSNHEPNMVDDKKFTDNLQAIVDYSSIDNVYDTSHVAENKILLEHSSKWKSMVGNNYMSDLTIFSKDEHNICGHTLVFHTQCPAILHDIGILETKPCKTKKVLMWLEYSYEACLAFLELIYSGQESRIKPEFREDYLNLGTRYNILMAVNDNQKNGWVSNDDDKICKRKSSELYDNPNDCKRYKASSPDMFMSDDDVNVETCTSINFLGPTVNDEKCLSMLKTKSWLYSQHHNSSFTENLVKNIPPPNNVPKQNPCRSFHSASTVGLILSSPSSHCTDPEIQDHKFDVSIKPSTDINISIPNLLSTSESDMKDISVLQNISTVTKLHEEPDLITINSDSEAESVAMIWSNNIKKSGLDNIIFNSAKPRNSKFLSQSTIKYEKNDSLCISCNAKSAKCGNCVDTIELNDNSLDSIYSVCTNKVYQRKYNMPSCSSFNDSIFNSEDKIINIDRSNVFSAVTNRLPTNRIFSSNNFIDLIEGSSSDSKSITDITNSFKNKNYTTPISNNAQQNGLRHSTSFSDVTIIKENSSVSQSDLTTKYEAINLTLNSSPLTNNLLSNYSFSKTDENYFTNSNKTISDNLDLNSSNSLNNCILPNNNNYSKLLSKSPEQSFQMDKVSLTFLNSTSNLKMNDAEDNSKSIDRLFSNDQNVVEMPNLDSELLENIATTSLILPTNYNSDSGVNTKESIDYTFLSSNNCKNKHLIITASSQVDSNQLSGVTIPNENIHELNTSNNEQIIDDPWMDYDDWPAVDFSPRCITPVLTNSTSVVLLDESEVQTPRKKNLNHIHLDLQTPSTISNHSNNINSQKKKSLTPNKYSSGISTPKSLRRVQSESVIGSKQQVTPLPEYSSMKTPDLRKEFDRYGLKDLGRRKGKLILRHIYDVLHPLDPSEKDNCNTEFEQYSSSSDISEHGIPDYEDGSYDELETFNPTNLSNKISVEAGFKQLLKTNENLHQKMLCYEPVWIEELKEDLKRHNVSISMQKLMTFLDDKCVTFRSKSLNDQRQKPLPKKSTKRKKLF